MIAQLGDAFDGGVIVLVGLSGTGKGTTMCVPPNIPTILCHPDKLPACVSACLPLSLSLSRASALSVCLSVYLPLSGTSVSLPLPLCLPLPPICKRFSSVPQTAQQ